MRLLIAILISAIIAVAGGFIVFAVVEAMIRGADPQEVGIIIGIMAGLIILYRISDPIHRWIKKRF
jgi:ammonia channel protein AmtB